MNYSEKVEKKKMEKRNKIAKGSKIST